MDEQTLSQIHNLYHSISITHLSMYHLWKREILWSWRWWLCLFGTIAPWVFWIPFRQKAATQRLLYGGLLIMVFSSGTDYIGTIFELWVYPFDVLPVIPPYIPWDYSTLPVVTMVFMQVKPNASPLLKAILYSALGSYVLEPIAEALQLYQPLHWRHWYTFVVLILLYLATDRMCKMKNFAEIKGTEP